jgi:hypothetical protein
MSNEGVTLLTPKFRVAFPKVFKPERNELSGADEYTLVALFDNDEDLSGLKAAIKQAAINKWGDKLPKGLRNPIRDGEEKRRDDGSIPAGYEGCHFVNMKCRKRPGVVDENLQDIIDEADFYGGCYARAQVHVMAYDQKGNKGVSCYLNHVQKLADGDAFGTGRVSPQQAFEAASGKAAGSSASSSSDALFD